MNPNQSEFTFYNQSAHVRQVQTQNNSGHLNQTFCPQQQMTPETRISEFLKEQIETQQENGGAPIRIDDLISKVKHEMSGKNADSSSLLIKVTEDEIEGLETKEELAMTEEEVLEKAFE